MDLASEFWPALKFALKKSSQIFENYSWKERILKESEVKKNSGARSASEERYFGT